jgi:uncharacterized protein involved in outer membrane biogenesis
MSSSKKMLFMSCISLVLFLLIFIVAMGKILTANLTKQFIAQKLEATTGYHVTIEGDLDWHYTLHPNVSIEKITFTSQATTIIQLEHANISVALLPLLQKRFAVCFRFQQWQQNQLNFSNGEAYLTYENNLLTLSDFNADFYQGHINGKAIVDLNDTIPSFQISLQTSQAEMAGLLNDIANTASVSGKMDMQADLKSVGSDTADFIHNLNGNINIIVKNGQLNTIHLADVISSITSNSQKKQADFFDTLKIQNAVVNGVANSTITLLAKSYKSTGRGNIDFNTQSLNLKLDAYYTQSQQTKNIAIPIHIQGAIAAPSVSIDLATPISQLLNANKGNLINRLHKLFG